MKARAKSKLMAVSAIVLIAALTSAPPIFAQDSAVENELSANNDDIVVAAPKICETLQETPISITPFTAEALEMKTSYE